VATDSQQFRELRDRNIDLLLGRMTPPLEEGIHAELLFYDRAVVVAGPKNKWANRRKVRLSELSNESWCLPLTDRTIGSLVADAFRATGATFPPRGAMWGAATLMSSLLARGPYLAVFPASLLRFGAHLSPLRIVPVNLAIPPWQVGVMTLTNRTVTAAARLFVECAREVVKPLTGKVSPMVAQQGVLRANTGKSKS
jgi:DNA-binding transcriptional LysR family regulator